MPEERSYGVGLGGSNVIAVLYGRVSTEEQCRSGFSLTEQMKACRQRAETLAKSAAEPLTICEFTDDLSGELLERPGLQAALELLRREQVACFVCLDPDRLARRLMHQLLITDEIERRQCRLEFVQHDYQETAEGRLFYQMRGAIAEFEKAKILERTSRGQRGKIAAGGLPHVIRMYGYRFIKGADKRAKAKDVLVPDAGEAEWVRLMYQWCVNEKLGPLGIANRLNELGVLTKTGKGLWRHTQVRRILTHPVYSTGLLALGKQDHRGIGVARRLPKQQRREKGIVLSAKPKPKNQWHHLEIASIVEPEIWDAAQAVLSGFRTGSRARGSRDQVRPLSGLGRCGLCGGRLYYLNGTKMVCSNRYQRYWRKPGHVDPVCILPAKSRVAVEAAVWQQVEAWLLRPDLLRQELGGLEEEKHIQPRPSPVDEAGTLKQEIRQREEEVERLGLLFARGLWPQEKVLPALEQAKRQLTSLQSRASSLQANPEARPLPQAGFLLSLLPEPEWLLAVQQTVRDLTQERRAELVRRSITHFELLPTGRGIPPRVRVEARL